MRWGASRSRSKPCGARRIVKVSTWIDPSHDTTVITANRGFIVLTTGDLTFRRSGIGNAFVMWSWERRARSLPPPSMGAGGSGFTLPHSGGDRSQNRADSAPGLADRRSDQGARSLPPIASAARSRMRLRRTAREQGEIRRGTGENMLGVGGDHAERCVTPRRLIPAVPGWRFHSTVGGAAGSSSSLAPSDGKNASTQLFGYFFSVAILSSSA